MLLWLIYVTISTTIWNGLRNKMKDFLALEKNLKLRLAIVFLGSFSYGTIFSSMTIYYNQHLGAAVTGILLAISAVLSFVAGLISGHLSDLMGRKKVMIGAILLQIIGALIVAFVNSPIYVNPWLTFFGFQFISVGYMGLTTAGNAMIIDVTDLKNRKIVFALDYWAMNLAIIFGAAIGAWLFKSYFFELVLILLAEILLTLLLAGGFMSETFSGKSDKTKNESIFQAYQTVAKDKIYMIFLLANTLSLSVIMQFDNFLPVHLANSFITTYFAGFQIYGQRMLTIYLIFVCIIAISFMGIFNRLTAKWSNLTGFISGLILMTVGMGIAFLTQTWFPMLISGVVYTIGEIIYTPSVQTIGANMMDPDKIGAYNGASSLRQPLSSMLAAALVSVSPFVKAFGVTSLMSLLAILAIIFCTISFRKFSRRKN